MLLSQVAANEWFSDILGNFRDAPTVGTGSWDELKSGSGLYPLVPRADGAIWHMVSYSSKILLSEISPKLEPLTLSLEICPILTSVGSLGCQQY